MSGFVFISYARSDVAYAEKLEEFLENQQIPAWFDAEIEPGEPFRAAIKERIEKCAAFVIVMSPAAERSEWVNDEFDRATRLGKQRLPLLLVGDGPILGMGAVQYEDVRGGLMPGERYLAKLREFVRPPGELRFELRHHQGHVLSVAYPAENPSVVASAGPEPCVRIWNPVTGARLVEIPGAAWPVSFTPDGSVIATGAPDFSVCVWNAATGGFIKRVGQHSREITSVAISPDGRTLVTGSRDTTERVWDVATGELRHTLTSGLAEAASPLVYFPNRDCVVAPTASGVTNASLWNVETGKLIRNFGGNGRGHAGRVHDVTVSRDGKRVATGGEDRTARIWDVDTGEQLKVLAAHTRPVRAVAFSPDGQWIATGSTDMRIHLWDASTGAHVKQISRRAGGIYDLAYSPDGRTLASGHGDGAIRIWSA